MLRLFWKAHIASDFTNGIAPQENNGVGKGGDVFQNFNNMIKSIGRDKYYICPILLDDSEVENIAFNIFRAKVSVVSSGQFNTVDYWSTVLKELGQ